MSKAVMLFMFTLFSLSALADDRRQCLSDEGFAALGDDSKIIRQELFDSQGRPMILLSMRVWKDQFENTGAAQAFDDLRVVLPLLPDIAVLRDTDKPIVQSSSEKWRRNRSAYRCIVSINDIDRETCRQRIEFQCSFGPPVISDVDEYWKNRGNFLDVLGQEYARSAPSGNYEFRTRRDDRFPAR